MPKRPPPSPRSRPTPKVVRRHDSLGRPYYTRESTGERVKQGVWERDLARRNRERSAAQYERARADAEERARREERRRPKREEAPAAPKPKRPRPRPPRGPELPEPPAPFPPGVSDQGVPDDYVDDDGVVWEAHEIEGDDDTGGK